MAKYYKNNHDEIKIVSQSYQDIVDGFMAGLLSVKSDQELLNWMQRVAESYKQTLEMNKN